MSKSILIYIFFSFLYFRATSQMDIISNGSFENNYSCPTYVGQIDSILNWKLPSYGSSDYFNTCTRNPDITIPVNTFGHEFPLKGDAYIGLGLYGEGIDYREYVQTKFTTPTVSGHIYSVSMYVSLGDNFSNAIKEIHMVFSESSVMQNSYQTIKVEPTIIFKDDYYFTNKTGWIKYQLFYLADNENSYLTMGNFYDDANTDLF